MTTTAATESAGQQPTGSIRAVLWDFGGVVLSSPFEAFARYETQAQLPIGTIRTLNATNPDTNAWAKFERSDVTFDEFCTLFEQEALAAGHIVDARMIMSLLHGVIRPEVVAAIRRCKAEGYLVACLTNNVTTGEDSHKHSDVAEVMALFDHVTESRLMGVRKPEKRFYELACNALGIDASEAIFLDDLGINLKPAAALGMRTIKVGDPAVALQELGAILQLDFASTQCNR
jgi:putative hydrolase of the HAD superfamily